MFVRILYAVSLGIAILSIGSSCKKQMQEKVVQNDEQWIVSTLAGDGTPSLADGPAANAQFHFPFDVAADFNGNIYVADVQNHCIRKIAGGLVSVFAGGDLGIADGEGSAAKFRYPMSITVDAAGNLYTSDVTDPRIRKIDPGAKVTTYAGSEEEGFADGAADIARFGDESALASDAEGNIYVADPQNNRIRKISTSRTVITIAGNETSGFEDGQAGKARFNFPDGIAVDGQGNIFVADGLNSCIRKIDPQGRVSTLAGTNKQGVEDGTGSSARFEYPTDMVIDREGNLFVLDLDRIRKIMPDGTVITIAGGLNGYQDGAGSVARFQTPAGLGMDAQGNIYVADTENNRIRRLSLK